MPLITGTYLRDTRKKQRDIARKVRVLKDRLKTVTEQLEAMEAQAFQLAYAAATIVIHEAKASNRKMRGTDEGMVGSG